MKTSAYKRHILQRQQERQKMDEVRSVDGDVVLADAHDTLRGMEPKSVAAIITDPPYGIAYHSNRHQERNPHSPITHDWDVNVGSYLSDAERVLQDGGAIYLFTRWDVYPIWAQEIPAGLALKNLIVWDKGNHSSGDLTGNFGFQHELIMFLVKGRHTLRGHRWSNVWSAAKIPHKKLRMAAEKPIELYERAILSSSLPGELVVDTFGGSGTLAEAAVRHGRQFLVCDVDKKMVRMARERVGLPVTENSEETRPALVPCPVFNVPPPSPALWGVHPEDLAHWMGLEEEIA
jgi:DNA modification methylase